MRNSTTKHDCQHCMLKIGKIYEHSKALNETAIFSLNNGGSTEYAAICCEVASSRLDELLEVGPAMEQHRIPTGVV